MSASLHPVVACVDIETVPDEEVLPPGHPEGEFPPLPCHRVVAISIVEAEIVRGTSDRCEWFRVTAVRSGGREDYSEAQLLRGFWSWVARARPRVVTWNGRKFDVPVLKMRAMVHGVSADHWHTAGDKWSGYMKRFSADWHCDLGDVLADFGAARMVGLDLMARAVGFPGKVGGHGSEVAEMVREGRIDLVRAYCEGDVLNLFALYVRWALLSGLCSPAGHNASMRSLVELLERARDARPHLGEFLDKWRTSTRPMPTMVPEPVLPHTVGEPAAVGGQVV